MATASREQMETMKVGRRGTIVIPSRMRKRFGMEEGTLTVVETRADGILIRPAAAVPMEIYSQERIAEFLLSNAVDAADYRRAEGDVRAMGFDPQKVPHAKPRKR